jgi:archaellum component FlaF (FlaF/FlaG flagellin family)
VTRQRDIGDDFELEDDEDEGAASRRRRLLYLAGAAVAVVAALVAAILIIRQQQAADSPTYTVTTRLVELPTTAAVTPDSFVCPAGGRGPVPWTAAVKPSATGGAGSGQLVAALMTVVAPPNAKGASDLDATMWLSSVTNQSKVGFDKDVPLCAFVDTGALASSLDQSETATASVQVVTNPSANLKEKRAGTFAAVQVVSIEPGRSASVVIVGRLAPFTGAPGGVLEAKVLEATPSRSGARVTPGGRDARATVGNRAEEGAVSVSLDTDRELWARGEAVVVRMHIDNRLPDAALGSVTGQVRWDPGLAQVKPTVQDAVGAPTACKQDVGSLTCTTSYLAPGEEVTVLLEGIVAADAVTQFTAKGAKCAPRSTDICVKAGITEVAGEPRDWASAELAGNVAADTVLGITKLPAGVADHVRSGELTRFIFLVTASQGQALKDVRLVDPGCANPAFVSGDVNLNEILDGGETWQYDCIAPAPKNADAEIAVSAVNAQGSGQAVKASGQLAVPVYDPKIDIQPGSPGGTTVLLSNTGNVTLRSLAVVGRGCVLASESPLLPQATVTITCRSATGVLRVFAVDPAGDPVTASADG